MSASCIIKPCSLHLKKRTYNKVTMSTSLCKFVVGGLFEDKTWESQMYKTILSADKFTNDHTQVDIM